MRPTGQPVVAYSPDKSEADGLSTSELLSRLSAELSRLIRDEVQLVRLELLRKSKRAGFGVGALGSAGMMAFFGAACLLAAAIVALSMVMRPWAAALLVGVVLLLGAGTAALIGRAALRHAVPSGLPEETVENLRADVRTVLEHAKR